MTDFERSNLALLAPVVDEKESRALFDARRSRRRSRRRVVLAGAVVGCLVLLTLGAAAIIRGNGGVSVDTGPATEPGSEPAPAFEVLTAQRANEQSGMLRAATDTASLATLWEKAGLEGVPPAVDFDRWVVVSMVIPEHACRPMLTGFSRDGDVLVPEFVEPDGACPQPPDRLETFVVSIDRSTVGPMFTVRLPARTSTPYYRGQPSIDLVPDEAAARSAGLIPPECIEAVDASLCLGVSTIEGLVALRGTSLQSKSTVTVTYPNGVPDEIPVLGQIITSFSEPSPGTILRIHVSGTTQNGEAIEGTIGTAG